MTAKVHLLHQSIQKFPIIHLFRVVETWGGDSDAESWDSGSH